MAGEGEGSLREFVDLHIPRHEGPDFRGLQNGRYYRSILDAQVGGDSAATLLAVTLWQILTETHAFREFCWNNDLPPVPWHERDLQVVAHGAESRPELDLLILDRAYPHCEARSDRLAPSRDDLVEAYDRWRSSRSWNLGALQQSRRVTEAQGRVLGLLFVVIDPDFAIAALRSSEFHVLAARMPDLRYTSVPQTPWPAAPQPYPASVSTAGAVVRHRTNARQIGVTVATHAVLNSTLANPVGWTVDVNGQPGTVVSCDVISDSCFVELAHIGPPNHAHATTSGLLTNGQLPSLGMNVHFDGCASAGRQYGQITSVSINFFNQHPLIQQTFNVNRLTNPGDSGAALLDAGKFLLGFAFCCTSATSNPSYSTWIWADSVIAYHQLQLF